MRALALLLLALLANGFAAGQRRHTNSGRISRRDPTTAANARRAQTTLPQDDYPTIAAKLGESQDELEAKWDLVHETGSRMKPVEYLALRLMAQLQGVDAATAQASIVKSATAREAAAAIVDAKKAPGMFADAKKRLAAMKAP